MAAATTTREYTKSWLALEESMGGTRTALQGSPEEMRAQFSGLMTAIAPLYPPPSDAVTTKDYDLGGFCIRTYSKKGGEGNRQAIGIYNHGGGYVLGSVDSEDAFCRMVVEHLDTVMVSIGYRLAPEAKAPAQLEDGLTGLKWALDNAACFGGDANKVYTIGSSAGGGLSLSLARKTVLGQAGVPSDSIKGIVGLVPVAFHRDTIPQQYKAQYQSYYDNGENVPIINATSMDQFLDYTGCQANDKDYLIGNDMECFGKLPPTYIVTCEFDPLRDDGKILEMALKEVGVPVKRDHYDGLPHCFWVFPTLPETQRFVANTFAGIGWVIGQM